MRTSADIAVARCRVNASAAVATGVVRVALVVAVALLDADRLQHERRIERYGEGVDRQVGQTPGETATVSPNGELFFVLISDEDSSRKFEISWLRVLLSAHGRLTVDREFLKVVSASNVDRVPSVQGHFVLAHEHLFSRAEIEPKFDVSVCQRQCQIIARARSFLRRQDENAVFLARIETERKRKRRSNAVELGLQAEKRLRVETRRRNLVRARLAGVRISARALERSTRRSTTRSAVSTRFSVARIRSLVAPTTAIAERANARITPRRIVLETCATVSTRIRSASASQHLASFPFELVRASAFVSNRIVVVSQATSAVQTRFGGARIGDDFAASARVSTRTSALGSAVKPFDAHAAVVARHIDAVGTQFELTSLSRVAMRTVARRRFAARCRQTRPVVATRRHGAGIVGFGAERPDVTTRTDARVAVDAVDAKSPVLTQITRAVVDVDGAVGARVTGAANAFVAVDLVDASSVIETRTRRTFVDERKVAAGSGEADRARAFPRPV